MPRQVSPVQYAWMVINPRGVMLNYTASMWRSSSIEKFTQNFSGERGKWSYWRKHEYQCEKIKMIRQDKGAK